MAKSNGNGSDKPIASSFPKDICACCAKKDELPLMGREKELGQICYSCAKAAVEAYENHPELKQQLAVWSMEQSQEAEASIPDPREVFAEIGKRVMGQEYARKIISIAAIQHLKNILCRALNMPVDMKKRNILLVGPTGVGKTEIARSLANILDVPFAIGDATCLSEAGYVGEDVENLLLKLVQAADDDIDAAQKGIIFIDELDKIGKRSNNVSITRDVSGEGVQQALLKILEGTESNVPVHAGRKHPEAAYLQVDTHDILFICGGTFDGIEDIVASRINQRNMGFGSKVSIKDQQEDRDELRRQIIPDDLTAFGMLPELVGRFPIIAPLHALDKEILQRILKEPEHSLVAQYQQSCEMGKVQLEFEDAALAEIASLSYDRKIGARGLQTVMSKLMEDIEFNLKDYQGQKITVTVDMVKTMGTDGFEIKAVPQQEAA